VFFISAILYLNCNWKTLLGISIAILIGYWLFLGFVPFPNPEGISPSFDRVAHNWAIYIDSNLLAGHMWQPDYDPEGVFSTLPAIVSCLFGILIGMLIDTMNNRVILLFGAAFIFLLSGYVFSLWFPINKSIWSSSFVLVTCGWGTLILGIIYYLTDVKKIKIGSVFKYTGMNAITIYVLSCFVASSFYLTKIGDGNIHSWLYNTLFNHGFLSDKLSSLIYALVVVGFYLGLGYVMYRKKVFIKV